MKTEEIAELFHQFEAVAFEIEGIECWSARDLQKLLGYSKWVNFEKVIDKAKAACSNAGEGVEDHFPNMKRNVEAGKGAQHVVDDIVLTRYACYLVAQNGDSRKLEIAFAQNYFAVQTRKTEIIEKRVLEYERVKAREKLSQTEKQLSGILFERGVDSQGFAIIRSKGDQALFRLSTLEYKKKMGIPANRPIADFLPIISIKAKDLAAEMTSLNVVSKDLYGQNPIEGEHIENNDAVREMLTKRGILPESLPKAEDVKKVQRKLLKDDKKIIVDSKRKLPS